jgi:hypothetical protein
VDAVALNGGYSADRVLWIQLSRDSESCRGRGEVGRGGLDTVLSGERRGGERWIRYSPFWGEERRGEVD